MPTPTHPHIHSRKNACSILEINIKIEVAATRAETTLQALFHSSCVHPGWKCKHSRYVRCFEWMRAWKGTRGRERERERVTRVCGVWISQIHIKVQRGGDEAEQLLKSRWCSRWVHVAVCCKSNQNTLRLTDVIIDFTQMWTATNIYSSTVALRFEALTFQISQVLSEFIVLVYAFTHFYWHCTLQFTTFIWQL